MTSSVISGLAGIRKHQEAVKARQEAANQPKAVYLSSIYPKKTGDVIVARFMQELDDSATGYDPERGLAVIAVEHEAPGGDGFKRRGLCTADEGACYPDERKKLDYEPGKDNWKTKTNLYVNVAVEFEGEVKVYVLSRNASSSFAEQLIAEAVDEGTITDKMFRITKTGADTTTAWLLKPLPKEPLIDDSKLELFDIKETVLRNIEYDKQAEYYGAVWSGRGNEVGVKTDSGTTVKVNDAEVW